MKIQNIIKNHKDLPMNWSYYDEGGYLHGPISGAELRQLALDGTVTRATRIMRTDGKETKAENIKGLVFREALPIPEPIAAIPPEPIKTVEVQPVSISKPPIETDDGKLAERLRFLIKNLVQINIALVFIGFIGLCCTIGTGRGEVAAIGAISFVSVIISCIPFGFFISALSLHFELLLDIRKKLGWPPQN